MKILTRTQRRLRKMLKEFYSQELWRKWAFFLPDQKEKLDYLKEHTEQQKRTVTALQSEGRAEVKKWLELRAVLLMHKIHESNEVDSAIYKNRLFELLAMRKTVMEIDEDLKKQSPEEKLETEIAQQ